MGSAVCAASWWWPKLSLVFYALARRCSCAAECNWLRVIMGSDLWCDDIPMAFPREGYNNGAKRRAFISEALRRWREISGVIAAGAGSSIPWAGYDDNTSFDIPGRPAKPA